MNEKLENLKLKRQQINERIKKLEASEKLRNRKEDTRRKILIGAYYLEKSIANNTKKDLYKDLYNYVNRDIDKKLFKESFNKEEIKETEDVK